MARIPMKGDPPTLKQIVEKYGDPIDRMASIYFNSLKRAEQYESAEQLHDAIDFRKMDEKCRKKMAKYGFVPEMVDGEAKAKRT